MVTTIQLSEELKQKIASFGSKNETYEQILEKLYSLAVKEHLRLFLMSDENTVSIEEARAEVNKKWPRSR